LIIARAKYASSRSAAGRAKVEGHLQRVRVWEFAVVAGRVNVQGDHIAVRAVLIRAGTKGSLAEGVIGSEQRDSLLSESGVMVNFAT
jgi:hypothetical protein